MEIMDYVNIIIIALAMIIACVKLSGVVAAKSENVNVYGVNKDSGKDNTYNKMSILVACAAVLVIVINIVYSFAYAASYYNMFHEKEFMEQVYLYGTVDELEDTGHGCMDFYEKLQSESITDYLWNNPHEGKNYWSMHHWDNSFDYGDTWLQLLVEDGYIEEDAFYGYYYWDDDQKLIFTLYLPIILGLIFFLYMFPSKVARKKAHEQTKAIIWLNFLFGLTVIGWIAMLMWANSAKKLQGVQSDNLNISDKLMELQQLKDKGILTSEEFEEKKKELISKY